ncbi:AbrB/MazE/SpoVT family DNA-binding domain-containing protein [Patescibacteria group bacterium]|nr:AbrB/MazE/SpoVT family DNA-binding domain-containing protein [Patescibacteria group bacterium]
MRGLSTLTQKGQVVIPKDIRDHFALKPSDKLSFRVLDAKIVAEPVDSTDEVFGMFGSAGGISKAKMKRVIREQTVAKFHDKLNL